MKIFLDSQHQGGIVMWIIFATGIVALYIGLDKAFFLSKISRCRKKFITNIQRLLDGKKPVRKIGFEEYEMLLSQLQQSVLHKQNGQKGYFREFLISAVPVFESHFSTMKAWVSIAPLLGLLGTVMGMVQTFKVIMDFGVGNPALTAEGISVALLTTQAGLIVAFPIMLFHNYLVNKKNDLLSMILKDFEGINSQFSQITTPE